MEKQFYRIREVADVLGIGRSLAYKLVAEGAIPSVYVAGTSCRRVSATALARFVEEQTSAKRTSSEDNPM